jgi:hypothetical protein
MSGVTNESNQPGLMTYSPGRCVIASRSLRPHHRCEYVQPDLGVDVAYWLACWRGWRTGRVRRRERRAVAARRRPVSVTSGAVCRG